MTAKQYLQQGYRLNELIKSHQEELANLHSLVGSAKATAYGRIGGKAGKWNGDTAEHNLAIQYMDLECLIQREIEEMVNLMQQLHTTIEAVPNKNQRLVLRCRYILFLSWEDTAARMCYSYPQVRRIHQEALKNILVPGSCHGEKMSRNDQF